MSTILQSPVGMSASPVLPAMPVTPRNQVNAFSRIEGARDAAYEVLESALKERRIEGLVIKSTPYSPSPFVKLELWLPEHEGADAPPSTVTHFRSTLTVKLTGFDLRPFPVLYKLEFDRGNKRAEVPNLRTFDRDVAMTAIDLLTEPQRRIKSRLFPRCKMPPIRFRDWFLPSNRIQGLKRRWEVPLRRYWFFWLPFTLVLFFPIGLPVALYVMYLMFRHRVMYSMAIGKPAEEPRSFLRMDSWQAVINGLGSRAEGIKSDIASLLTKTNRIGVSVRDETIWNWGLDGKEERNQTVIRFRRAVAFLHVYEYGEDLYIGWDAHLSLGTWVEKKVGAGICPVTGRMVTAYGVVPGVQHLTEYDVTDANCLIEWVHAAVSRVAHQAMADHRIDQEVDFTILREERRGIVKERTGSANKRGRFSRIR